MDGKDYAMLNEYRINNILNEDIVGWSLFHKPCQTATIVNSIKYGPVIAVRSAELIAVITAARDHRKVCSAQNTNQKKTMPR